MEDKIRTFGWTVQMKESKIFILLSFLDTKFPFRYMEKNCTMQPGVGKQNKPRFQGATFNFKRLQYGNPAIMYPT